MRRDLLYLSDIVEAATHISQEMRDLAPSVPWGQIVGFRNIAVHAYFNMDWTIVWVAATADTPTLVSVVSPLLSQTEIEDRYRTKADGT